MSTIFGTRCAGLLIPLDLSFETTIHMLMGDLDLTYEEAASALLEAQAARLTRS